MFAKTGKTMTPPTIIARGCKILGDIHHLGELHLEGEVVGSLHCDRLVICDGASVCGDIDGKTVTIAGKVSGQVSADSVDIGATAQIDGDIEYAAGGGAHELGLFVRSILPVQPAQRVRLAVRITPY